MFTFDRIPVFLQRLADVMAVLTGRVNDVDGEALTLRLRAMQIDTLGNAASLGMGPNMPSRQVHGLLLLAAARTQGILWEPPPRVIQRALPSFDNEYVLHARVAEGYVGSYVFWKLNAQVHDTFEEYGVPIVEDLARGGEGVLFAVPDRPDHRDCVAR